MSPKLTACRQVKRKRWCGLVIKRIKAVPALAISRDVVRFPFFLIAAKKNLPAQIPQHLLSLIFNDHAIE